MAQNCRDIFELNTERIAHFKQRARVLQKTSEDAVIVILCVDDPFGGPLADALMPDYNWDEIRARGEIPYARGLAERSGIENALFSHPKGTTAAHALRNHKGSDVAVVVVDFETAEVFTNGQSN